jgi:hypothetical protein
MKGLVNMYNVVRRKNGTSPEFAFVLTERDPNTPEMLRYYADLIEEKNPVFATDLRNTAVMLEAGLSPCHLPEDYDEPAE